MAAEDHTGNDCVLVALMSHGDDGILYAKDQAYILERLWSHFTSDQCPTLDGKPKIFFIQVEIENGNKYSRLINHNFRLNTLGMQRLQT